jgi:prolyl-tRNA editing enzyme YbaK/EbsC (Cys-tRNA(Pro) deacylase)
MSLASVRAHLSQYPFDLRILETEQSTATVALAAQAHGVEPGRIAKTLAFRLNDARIILLVARGDARIDNSAFKATFGKGKMLGPEEVLAITGHPVGGVCPFGLAQSLPIYLDQTLRDFDPVLPAAGSVNSAVLVTLAQLEAITQGTWVRACSPPVCD